MWGILNILFFFSDYQKHKNWQFICLIMFRFGCSEVINYI